MNKYTAMGGFALLAAVLGGVLIGGAAFIGQGETRGTGNASGIGILAPLEFILILFALGTRLAAVVTYLVRRD